MSERMPEVGDVWEVYSNKYLVLEADKITVDVLTKYLGYNNRSFLTKEFVKTGKYLGKSKANINQLFEVQDE